MAHKLSWPEIKAQARWLYSSAHGFKRCILLLTGISSASSLLGVWSALLIKSLIDIAVGSQSGHLPGTAILLAAVMASEIILNAVQIILSTKSKTRQANHLQIRLFRKYLAAKWQTLSAAHSGDYCNLMLSDVDVVNSFLLTSIPDIISTFTQLLAAVFVLLRLEPGLAILAMTITPVFVVLMRLFARPMREASLNMQGLKGKSLSLSQETIQNVITIRAFERQNDACNKLCDLQNSLLYWIVRRTKLNALSGVLQSVSWSATYILSLMWGISQLSQKSISYGSIAAYLQLVSQIQGPIQRLVSQIPQMIATSASVSRITEALNMPEETLCQNTAAFLDPIGVALQDVCFAYQEGGSVLNRLNMEVLPGAMTALVGSTGEGKSTIVRLLLGLVEPNSGSIYLKRQEDSGYPVGAYTRSAFTYVQQGNSSLSGTIADNLRLAKPTATKEEMETVLRQACAWEFVSALPDRTESHIGEHGVGLSEGQQQRLAIARALLRNAPILILDEATSALDKKTEEQVLKNIQSALHGRTCLVITHRSAALMLCSRVYLLSGGKAYLTISNLKNSKIRFKAIKSRSIFRSAPAS